VLCVDKIREPVTVEQPLGGEAEVKPSIVEVKDSPCHTVRGPWRPGVAEVSLQDIMGLLDSCL
jgi:hypothetical protein